MGQHQKIHADANAGNTSGARDVGRPPEAAAPTMCWFIMWLASIFSSCLRMYFLLLPPIIFLLLAHLVFSAFGQYCISGPTGPGNPCFSASLYEVKGPFPLDLCQIRQQVSTDVPIAASRCNCMPIMWMVLDTVEGHVLRAQGPTRVVPRFAICQLSAFTSEKNILCPHEN